MKLSDTMKKSLQAVAEHGGVAVAEGGGWWQGADGVRLTILTDDWRGTDTVKTLTIYALEDRGLLQRSMLGNARHRDTWRLTQKGRDIVDGMT